ncbi:alpha/beta hydrolase [Candidatus Contubernalis alkaliaceticus]|uniref:alpha/beta hydrolase n=1 Tax=Candidatus Contubernalis alkaliaceticus TaxID=338645 RepID=UPI001F4BD01B|nr:alpha/beta hydrolase [Candidatus Contubernalis alkalaceticus]UNC92197.1 alpha/beta hydrolase [Candidatus Contubernalis alkalaceticus]
MKRIYLIMAVMVVFAIVTHIALDNVGYHKIQLDDGILYGKASGKDKDLVVLIAAGSGPTDMDGNSPLLQGRNDCFLQMAKSLEREGISTFRYDKRTAGKSAGSFDFTNMEFERFVDDFVGVIRYLKEQGYQKIFVMGHSKGSLVGMLASLEEPIDGFISIGGTGVPIDVTLEKQLSTYYSEESLEMKTLQSLKEGKTDPTISDEHPLFNLENQRFFLTWMEHDPGEIISRLDIPILLIHGEADSQVDNADFEALKAGSKDAEALIIKNMNHVMKEVFTDDDNIASYSDPSYPLHNELVPGIVEFISFF